MEGKCFECESYGEIDNHHVVPKSLGGTKTVPLCYKCHGLVHNKNFIEHRRLLLIGIAKAKEEGKFKGRLKGSMKSDEEYLKLQKSIDTIKYFEEGMSYRNIVKKVGSSLGTVQKIINIYKKSIQNTD